MEALIAALSANPEAMILAGGHSLLPAIANRGQRSGHLIDVGRIAMLKCMALDNGAAVIGAGVTLSALLASPVAGAFPALADAVRFVGNAVVRNRSTVGGCLGWADPRGELLLIFIAHDAVIVTSEREIAAEALVTGPFATVLHPGEVILKVRVPMPQRIAFDEIIARNSTGRAMLSAVCSVDEGGCVRMSVGGLVDRPLRSDVLPCEGENGFRHLAETFVRGIVERFPALPDASSMAYRQTVAPRLLRRCYLKVTGA